VLALGSFVVIGLPDGIIGTAWPSMRVTFGAPVGDLGFILLLATAGSVLVTIFVGALIQRLGVPALLAVAGFCLALAAAGFGLAPGFGVVLGVAVLGGAAAGMMDAGLNTAVARSSRPLSSPDPGGLPTWYWPSSTCSSPAPGCVNGGARVPHRRRPGSRPRPGRSRPRSGPGAGTAWCWP